MGLIDALVYITAEAIASVGGCIAGIAQEFGNRKRFWLGVAVSAAGIGAAAIWTLSKL